METAFVLISTRTGSETDVLKKVRAINGVEEAFVVYGVYDIVAKLKADTMGELKEIVLQCIRKRSSITSTLTLIVAEE
ncbi:MAG: Lrp/AsnC ligand binding domain-containing protein [Candidatus Bathyarchaeota archaeon]|nr:Lrp/AsnC ligand binding domain-containing protein [Candidatus Bathyarchaeota archaeon]MDH5746900.1 Lrp/AsnC ligand binding domain-containing protein [Candidatus Bathyarchaeota archaeon]